MMMAMKLMLLALLSPIWIPLVVWDMAVELWNERRKR